MLRLGLFDGAYYLGGYAVECALKACIAKETKRYEFPDKKRVDSSYTHSLRELVKVAGLEEERLDRANNDPDFQRHWEVVREWTEQSRYQKHLPESARILLLRASDRHHGVISWIKLHW